jgi:hydroxymethylbilane synthase
VTDAFVAGTRKSALARTQTALVRAALEGARQGIAIREELIVTKGDRILDSPLSKIGDKGLFTREIEERLLDGTIDLAVHSYKDLPTVLPQGLRIGAVLVREAPEDALVARSGVDLTNLAPGARVAAGALRRIAQLRRRRPDLRPVDIRGNVDTRLKKLDDGEYDALILAAAGLRRLGREDRIASLIPDWYYAVGQGAIAVEIREDDDRTAALVAGLEDAATRMRTDAERAFLHGVEGGCQIPVGVRTRLEGGTIRIEAMIAGLDGTPFLEDAESGPSAQAGDAGMRLAARMLDAGGRAILEAIRR